MGNDLIGAQLGNYEIEGALGQGGMGRVYKAWDTTLKRPAAIKVVQPNLSSDERYRERFEREAQAVAALEHSHIVPIYYFGKTQNLYYLAMKFVEGEDLGTLMNRYATAGEYLPVADIVRIVEGIASALDYAHRKGVIHRDIKPSNIMIDREGHPYLADFGLALSLSQGTIGDVLGSPHYVSPEQARNSANAVSQSDLYSLGIVLYELFTGVVPFDDPNPTAVALQHITKDPPPPRALNPDLSVQLEAVILKAISKLPEDRYQTGKELVENLRTAVQNDDKSRRPGEFPALPPLPPGVQPPIPRQPSMRPVAAEVRASLAQNSTRPLSPSENMNQPKTKGAVPKSTVEHQAASTILTANGGKQPLSYIPLLVLGGVIVAVLAIVAVVALSLNRAPSVAAIPTLSPTAVIEPTANNEVAQTDVPLSATSILLSEMPETPIATVPVASSTPEPTIATTVPPSATVNLPTVEPTTILVEVVPSAPTSAPSDWLPVRFIYNPDAFYWMNDSSRTISSRLIAFERVDGTERFEGNRFAYYSMEAGRCMQIMFADLAGGGCPESRRANSFFTPTRSQGIDFWTGSTGQFRVLWNNVEIAICDIPAGLCSAYVPPE